MAAIQVVLTQHVDKLGKAGDLVKVKPGYARNFLLPRGFAITASRDNIAQLERAQQQARARSQKAYGEASTLAARLGELEVKIAVQAGEGDRIFGAVTAKDICAEMKKQHDVELDRKQIVLPSPLKQLGTQEIDIRLGPEVTAKIKVTLEKLAS